MNILYMVSLFPCWSETFIVRELHALKAKGCDISVYSLKPASEHMVHEDAAALLDQTLYPSSPMRILMNALIMFSRRPLLNLRLLYRVLVRMAPYPQALVKSLVTGLLALDAAARLQGDPPERIHAHWATYPSTAAWIISQNLNIPFGFTSHAHDIFLENHLLREKMADASLVVTISAFNQRYLMAQVPDLTPERINIVHCGVNLADFALTPLSDNTRIVSVGRFDEIKGFVYLIDACAALHARGVTFSCEIVGEGPLGATLQQRIDALGVASCVTLSGAKTQAEVRTFIADAAIFCLPSVKTASGNMDGIPVVLMEAMALGTPVVSTQVSGIPELVIDEKTGLLCPPKDADALADALARLLHDPQQRARLRQEAREKVSADFDCTREADKLARLFEASA